MTTVTGEATTEDQNRGELLGASGEREVREPKMMSTTTRNDVGKRRRSIASLFPSISITCVILMFLMENAVPARSETTITPSTSSSSWKKEFTFGTGATGTPRTVRGRAVDAILYSTATAASLGGEVAVASLFAWGDPHLAGGSGQVTVVVGSRGRGNATFGTQQPQLSSLALPITFRGGQLGANFGASVALALETSGRNGRLFLAAGAPSHVITDELGSSSRPVGSTIGSTNSQAGVVGGVYIYHANVNDVDVTRLGKTATVGMWQIQGGVNGDDEHPHKLGGTGNSPTLVAGYDSNQKYHYGFGTSIAFMVASGDDHDENDDEHRDTDHTLPPLFVACNPNDKSRNAWQEADKTGAYDSSHGRCFYYQYNQTETRWEPHPPAYKVTDHDTMLQVFVGGRAGDEYGTDVSGGCCLGRADYTHYSVVGAPRGDRGGGEEDTGYARVVAFHEPTRSWQNYWEFHGSHPGDECGAAVVATKHSSLVAIGCPGVVADDTRLPVGQIRVFELSTEGPIRELGKDVGILGQSSGDRLGRLGTFDFTINTGSMDTSPFDESIVGSALGMVVTTGRGVVRHYAFVNNVWMPLDPTLETVDSAVEENEDDSVMIKVAAVSSETPENVEMGGSHTSSVTGSLVAISAPVDQLFADGDASIYEHQIHGEVPRPPSQTMDLTTIIVRPAEGGSVVNNENGEAEFNSVQSNAGISSRGGTLLGWGGLSFVAMVLAAAIEITFASSGVF